MQRKKNCTASPCEILRGLLMLVIQRADQGASAHKERQQQHGEQKCYQRRARKMNPRDSALTRTPPSNVTLGRFVGRR